MEVALSSSTVLLPKVEEDDELNIQGQAHLVILWREI